MPSRGAAQCWSPQVSGPPADGAPIFCAHPRWSLTRWLCPCGSRAAMGAPHPSLYLGPSHGEGGHNKTSP